MATNKKKKDLIAHLIIWPLLAAFVCACGFLYYRQNVAELAPGIRWWKTQQRSSMITWEGRGIVAKGDLNVLFCDDGIAVSCDGDCIYLDLLRNDVLRSDNVNRRRYLDSHDSPYRCYGVDMALGTYHNADWSSEFKNDRQQLLERVALLKAGRSLE